MLFATRLKVNREDGPAYKLSVLPDSISDKRAHHPHLLEQLLLGQVGQVSMFDSKSHMSILPFQRLAEANNISCKLSNVDITAHQGRSAVSASRYTFVREPMIESYIPVIAV